MRGGEPPFHPVIGVEDEVPGDRLHPPSERQRTNRGAAALSLEVGLLAAPGRCDPFPGVGRQRHAVPPVGRELEGTGRVFYSTTPESAQFRTSGVEADKLAPRPIRMGRRKGK